MLNHLMVYLCINTIFKFKYVFNVEIYSVNLIISCSEYAASKEVTHLPCPSTGDSTQGVTDAELIFYPLSFYFVITSV